MVLNAAVQMLREADELKQKILKFKSGTSMLQEQSLWVTQQQLQKVYQKVLVLDLDYALEKKVEQDLWNVGFKQQIEALQAISKDRKNPQRSEGQAMLSWVLQAAAGYYLCLLHQICTTFKLDLPFRRRASLLGWVEGWGTGVGETTGSRPPPAAARYICQHCLVHLGDLARYRQQLRVAHTFYRKAFDCVDHIILLQKLHQLGVHGDRLRHALVVSVHSGQPYNQLALVSWRRGRRLAALYWHVRSLLVAAPFPPAPANLARTLHAAASGGLSQEPLPVLPGLTGASTVRAAVPTARLDANGYITELIRAMHMIHTVEQLDTATSLVDKLNSSLPPLVAANNFESMTLVKMSVVVIWLVHSSSEDLALDSSSLSEGEAAAVQLSTALAAGLVNALALVTAANNTATRQLPALKVWLQWYVCQVRAPRTGAWAARQPLWAALAAALAHLADRPAPDNTHERCPLPEDEELHGFAPLQPELEPLRFVAGDWDTYSGRLPHDTPHEQVWSPGLEDRELQESVRIHRILQLGRRLASLRPDHLTCTEEEDALSFSAPSASTEQLAATLASLTGRLSPAGSALSDSDDDRPPPPPPVIISEADFREKVREKRVGILKPQGSLERAREERAMACTQEDQPSEGEEETSKSEDKKEIRKPRVNIAMAAIMRKQEESNKQVKFITPPPTPESTTESIEKEQDKPKVIQPKAIKGIVTLPLGRKTGGILSLKDKSAGYPHLVNTDPEPAKKTEEEKKKETKPQGSSQNSQSQQKRQEHPPSPNWGANTLLNTYDNPRMNFQKNYGIQNAGITYNPNYPTPTNLNNHGIRLPVVNPKEIDVRSAALQKQTSRAELFQDGHKFTHGYQISGDKKNFLNDLPPRFANQYRYWQTAQENQFNDNKFRDDNFKPNTSLFNSPQNWPPVQSQESYQQPVSWWKDNPPPNFNASFNQPMNMHPNFYSPHMNTNLANPYQSLPSFNPMQNQNLGQSKPEGMLNKSNYLQPAIGQPQLQSIQNMAGSSNFNSPLNNFGGYVPSVGYDSSMYPQFNNNKPGFQQIQMSKQQLPGFQANKDLMDMSTLSFGSNLMDLQQRNMNVNFNDSSSGDAMKNLDSIGGSEGASSEVSGNTYSLFSGAPDTAWGQRQPQQSLWSGPGPSPLERLLEQQKQMKQPPAPQ